MGFVAMLRKTRNQILAIVIVFLLVAVGVFAYVVYYKPPKAPIKTQETPTLDTRISPYSTQGIIFEILRIRNRGIVDALLERGNAWKTQPTFYYITDIDDKQYVSKDVASAGGVETETLFNTWDTIFQSNKILERTLQEQPTSTLSLSIVQRDFSGLLGRRFADTEMAKFTVTYNYTNGHWTGEDYLNDSDGYGHYINENYEVWFNIYQTTNTYDEVPYQAKVSVYHINGTGDYSTYDPNNDGIPLPWDFKWGYDPFAYDNHSKLDPDKDGLTNYEEYLMENLFADPFHQDIYIESDGMQRGGLFDPPHILWEETAQAMIERFAEHNISLYIDTGWPGDPTNGGGELLPHIETLSQDAGQMLQFYQYHFADNRKGIFRYMVVGHNAGFCHPSKDNRYDSMAIDSSLYKLILKRGAFTPRTQRIVLASAAMHELGHSLGIAPWTWGGNDNMTFGLGKAEKQAFIDKWGNYVSVMNYYYIFDKTLMDYSNGSHGTGDQNDWKAFDLTAFKRDDSMIEYPGFHWPQQLPTTLTIP
jgi:hypothetical protein